MKSSHIAVLALSTFALVVAVAIAPTKVGKAADSPAQAASQSTQTVVEVLTPAPELEAIPEAPKPDSGPLAAYVLEAMTKWAPPSSMPKRDVSHYPSIAKDIAEVVLDPNEKPLWAADTNKGRTAIMVAALAFFESHFWTFVDQGQCNDYVWRKTKAGRATMINAGDCDGGIAASLWQMHIHEVVLTDDVWYYSFDARVAGRKGLATSDIIADRKLAAKAALHMLRKSINMSGGLSGYTGESGPTPKAGVRFAFAQNWSAKHPLK